MLFGSRHQSLIHTWNNLGKRHWRTWHSARLCTCDGPMKYLKGCKTLHRILHHVLKEIILRFNPRGVKSMAFCNQAMLRLWQLWYHHHKKHLHWIAIWAHTFDVGGNMAGCWTVLHVSYRPTHSRKTVVTSSSDPASWLTHTRRTVFQMDCLLLLATVLVNLSLCFRRLKREHFSLGHYLYLRQLVLVYLTC